MLEVARDGDAVLLPVKIVPGSRKTRFLGIWDGRARIAVSAPPEKGKANRAVVRLLSELLEIRRRQITIVAGETAPLKTIRIEGVSVDTVRSALPVD